MTLKNLITSFDNQIYSSSLSLLASTRTEDEKELRQICLDRVSLYESQIKAVEDSLANQPVVTED